MSDTTITAKEAKAEAKAAKARAKALRPWFKKPSRIVPLAFVAVVGFAVATSGGESATTDTKATTSVSEEKAVTEEPKSDITPAQANALRAAEQYLDTMPFSKDGLIEQLSSEYGSGYEKADAKWAVAQLDVDWNEQAVKSAENYLDTMPFSRDGLIEQLSSDFGSKFTVAQATYAADTLGL